MTGVQTCALPISLMSFIPFAMADLTSTWLALIWSHPRGIDIPTTIERSRTNNPSDLVSFHFLGRYELPYAQEVRAEIMQAAPELRGVITTWDDEQDTRRFAMYGSKLDSLYALAGNKKDDVLVSRL